MPTNTHSLDLESGSSQYAWAADSASLSQTGNMSVEAWVKFETFSGIFPVVAKWNDDGVSDRSYYFGFFNDNLFASISNDGAAAGDEITVAWTPSTGVWYHVAYTYLAATSKYNFYVNGSQQGTEKTGVETSISDEATKFQIGAKNADGTASAFFDGLIDEVRIWSDVRTPTEISDNYQKQLEGNETGLVSYWKLNNDYLDETTNNNDLTASGSPVFSTDVPFIGVTPIMDLTSKSW